MDRTVYVSRTARTNDGYGAAMMAAAARRAADRAAARKRAEANLTREVGAATRIGIKHDSTMGRWRTVTDRDTVIRLMLDPDTEGLEVWAV